MKRVLVVGGGISGLSLARFWRARGARVTATDSRPAPPMAARFGAELPEVELRAKPIAAFGEEELAEFDLIAAGPGIAPSDIRAPVEKIVGDAECFFAALAGLPRRPFVIAVTGTNGKSTTVALIARLSGAAAVGNIGYPLLDALAEWEKSAPPQVAAVELSSFQLALARPGFAFNADAACVLNVGEDHLDRHGDLAEYARIKSRIYAGARRRVVNRLDAFAAGESGGGVVCGFAARREAARAGDWFIDADARGEFASADGAEKFYVDEFSPPLRDQKQNALAALALLAPLNLDPAALRRGLADFAGLPHRLQTAGVWRGAEWIDDSKATNVGAACYAIAAVGRPMVLIAGGEAKGANFYPLARAAAGRVRLAALIGRDAELLEAAFAAEEVPTRRAASLADAVRIAAGAARRGDAVLLSPACASFDMFADYRARGAAFCAAARAYFSDDAAAVGT